MKRSEAYVQEEVGLMVTPILEIVEHNMAAPCRLSNRILEHPEGLLRRGRQGWATHHAYQELVPAMFPLVRSQITAQWPQSVARLLSYTMYHAAAGRFPTPFGRMGYGGGPASLGLALVDSFVCCTLAREPYLPAARKKTRVCREYTREYTRRTRVCAVLEPQDRKT